MRDATNTIIVLIVMLISVIAMSIGDYEFGIYFMLAAILCTIIDI